VKTTYGKSDTSKTTDGSSTLLGKTVDIGNTTAEDINEVVVQDIISDVVVHNLDVSDISSNICSNLINYKLD